jgi:hypothetical protein
MAGIWNLLGNQAATQFATAKAILANAACRLAAHVRISNSLGLQPITQGTLRRCADFALLIGAFPYRAKLAKLIYGRTPSNSESSTSSYLGIFVSLTLSLIFSPIFGTICGTAFGTITTFRNNQLTA